MQPQTPGTYGAPLTNAIIPKNPKTDFDAAKANGIADTLSQLTLQGPARMRVVFPTSAGSAGPITPTFGTAEWGNGPANFPTVAKTATGVYSVTAPATWTNSLTTPDAQELGLNQVETVAFAWAKANVVGNWVALALVGGAGLMPVVTTAVSGNVLMVFVYSVAVSGGALVFTPADLATLAGLYVEAG